MGAVPPQTPTQNIWQKVMNYTCGKIWPGRDGKVVGHRKWLLLDHTQMLNLF